MTFSYWAMRVLLLVRRPLGVQRFISILNSIYKFNNPTHCHQSCLDGGLVTFSYWTMRALLLVRRPLGVQWFISIRNSVYKFDNSEMYSLSPELPGRRACDV